MSQQMRLGKLATKVVYTKNGMDVFFYNTKIVNLAGRKLTLDTGGWFIATTRTRMNQVSNQFGLGYGVIQRNYEWYIVYGDEIIPVIGNKITIKLN